MSIKINNIKKIIKKKTVLDNINLEFESGKKYAIIGANGSGKTLLLKLISGLLIPTNGNIYINGEELHKDFRFYESMGLIIETINFYDNILKVKTPVVKITRVFFLIKAPLRSLPYHLQ